jgi:hypothetical protein
MQITKKNLRNPKLPKDLSTSNAVTVTVVPRRTLVDPMRGLCSRTSIDDEYDIADLKVMKILEQRLRRHTSGTSTYSHTCGDYDDSWNPRSSQDCGSRWRWTGIWKLRSTMAWSGGEISHLCNPLGGHAGERGKWRWLAAMWRWRAVAREGGARGVVLCSPLLGPLFILVGGVHHCPLPKP